MIEDGPLLTPEQAERLTTMLEEGLAALSNPAVRLVPIAEYMDEPHRGAPHPYDLSIDIDVGTTVLTLRLLPHWPRHCSSADLAGWKDDVVEHVRLALGDHAGAARIAAGERTLSAKIKRERSDIELLSLRPAPAWIHEPAPFSDRGLRARVRMLDDALHPCVMELEGNTARGICSSITRRAADQRRRRAALGRMSGHDAALEIDSAAEHAIVASGRSVAEVAHALRGRLDADGHVRRLEVHAEPIGFQVSLHLQDGRIVLEAILPNIRWSVGQELVVFGAFPDTIMAALVGRPLRTVLEHPFLPGDAEIADATAFHTNQTAILLKPDVRLISHTELAAAS